VNSYERKGQHGVNGDPTTSVSVGEKQGKKRTTEREPVVKRSANPHLRENEEGEKKKVEVSRGESSRGRSKKTRRRKSE